MSFLQLDGFGRFQWNGKSTPRIHIAIVMGNMIYVANSFRHIKKSKHFHYRCCSRRKSLRPLVNCCLSESNEAIFQFFAFLFNCFSAFSLCLSESDAKSSDIPTRNYAKYFIRWKPNLDQIMNSIKFQAFFHFWTRCSSAHNAVIELVVMDASQGFPVKNEPLPGLSGHFNVPLLAWLKYPEKYFHKFNISMQ